MSSSLATKPLFFCKITGLPPRELKFRFPFFCLKAQILFFGRPHNRCLLQCCRSVALSLQLCRLCFHSSIVLPALYLHSVTGVCRSLSQDTYVEGIQGIFYSILRAGENKYIKNGNVPNLNITKSLSGFLFSLNRIWVPVMAICLSLKS